MIFIFVNEKRRIVIDTNTCEQANHSLAEIIKQYFPETTRKDWKLDSPLAFRPSAF